MLTGGGPPPSSPPAEDRELMEAIPQEFTVDSNIYDSDSINTQPLMSHPDPPQPETIHPAPAPVLPNVTKPQKSSPSSTPGKRPKSKKFKSDSCWEGHSQELFELAKKGKEEAMLREKEAHEHKMMHERELHKIRVRVASLEEE